MVVVAAEGAVVLASLPRCDGRAPSGRSGRRQGRRWPDLEGVSFRRPGRAWLLRAGSPGGWCLLTRTRRCYDTRVALSFIVYGHRVSTMWLPKLGVAMARLRRRIVAGALLGAVTPFGYPVAFAHPGNVHCYVVADPAEQFRNFDGRVLLEFSGGIRRCSNGPFNSASLRIRGQRLQENGSYLSFTDTSGYTAQGFDLEHSNTRGCTTGNWRTEATGTVAHGEVGTARDYSSRAYKDCTP